MSSTSPDVQDLITQALEKQRIVAEERAAEQEAKQQQTLQLLLAQQ
jgi:hypothetical protein